MKVKCPKCRLRFDVYAAPGISEVQCNCPRCGTPFTYNAATESPAANEHGDETPTSGNDKQKAGNESLGGSGVAYDSRPNGGKAEETAPHDNAPHDSSHHANGFYEYRHGRADNGFAPPRHSNRHALTFAAGVVGALAVAAIIAFAADRLVGHFTDGDEALMEQLAVIPDTTAADSASAGNAATIKKAKKTVPAAKTKETKKAAKEAVAPSALPAWVRGRWHIMTDNNVISIRISGNHIRVSDFYHTNTGSVALSGNTLVCRFRDGRTFTYSLDMRNHRIIDGHGTVLER